MSIWGKVMGGAAGFALGGPIGALVGAAAGHAYDVMRADAGDRRDSTAGPDPLRSVTFTIGVIVLGAKMAKADGAVSRSEVNTFKRVFHIPPEDMKAVGRIFDRAKSDAVGFEPYARQIAHLFRDRPAVLEELLEGLFRIAEADGVLHDAEIAYLRRVAEIFGISAYDFERVASGRAARRGQPEVDPYTVLGVVRSASNDDIKQAYRRLLREHHPDRLIAQGMPKEFIDVATEKMATINVAYDQIKAERGLT